MQLPAYLGLTKNAEEQLALAFETIAKKHPTEVDVLHNCKLLASWSKDHAENLKLQIEKYSAKKSSELKDITSALFNNKTGNVPSSVSF